MILYDAVIKPNNTVPHGREGLFIGENGTFTWGEICAEIAKVLYDKGIGKSPEATTFTSDELVKYFGSEVSICVYYAVGYEPTATVPSTWATFFSVPTL